MPRLPIIIESRPVGALELPAPPAAAFGIPAFKGLSDLGETLGKLQEGADKAEAARSTSEARANWEARFQQHSLEIQDPDEFNSTATAGIEEVRNSALESASNQRVKSLIAAGLSDDLIRAKTKIEFEGYKKKKDKALGDYEATKDSLIKGSIDMPDDVRQKNYMEFGSLLGSLTARGFLDNEKAAKEKIGFESAIQEGRMEQLRRTNRANLFEQDRQGAFKSVDVEKRFRILEQARRDEEREETKQTQVFKRVQDVAEQQWSAAANQGQLTDADINEALTGRHPYITPDKARQFKQINDAPPTGEGSDNIRAIVTEYHMGSSTIPRIEAARKKLSVLVRSGVKSPLLDKALDELQTDQRTMESIDAVKLNKAISDADTQYQFNAGTPIFGGMLGKLQKNQQALDRAEIRKRVKKGEDPAKAVKDVLDRRKLQNEKIPEPNKKVLDLTK